jgi:hypothetical protein
LKTFALLLLAALPPATFYVNIAGLGGELTTQRFKMWADISMAAREGGDARDHDDRASSEEIRTRSRSSPNRASRLIPGGI